MRNNLRRLVSLFLILALGLFPVQSGAEAEASDWMTAYDRILAGWKVQTAEAPENTDVSPELSYLIYDIDKDAIPELIVKTGTCEADYHGAIYTFRDGQAVQAGGELSLGHRSFYSNPGDDGIIMMWAQMGYASVVRISLTGGYTEELLYEDNLNDRLEEDPDADYIYPGDVIPGSVYLTMCPGNLTLAMTHYEEIMRCLDGVLPAAPEERYPNQDAAFFENLINGNGGVFAATADGFTNSPGRIGFQELLRQDVVVNWMQGDLSILSVTPADLNGDGKLECCVAASDGSSEVRIILSEQGGTVFAYLISYAEGYAPDAEGNLICSKPYGQFRYRLICDGEQAFLLSLPKT